MLSKPSLLGSSLLMGAMASANALVIDDFTDYGSPTYATQGGSDFTTTDGNGGRIEGGSNGVSLSFQQSANVIGGSRAISAQLQAGRGNSLVAFEGEFDEDASGIISLNSGPGDVNFLGLTYDAFGQGLGADFSQDDGIQVKFPFTDHFGLGIVQTFVVELVDSMGAAATSEITFDEAIFIGGATELFFDFGTLTGDDINLADIDSLSFSFPGDDSNDFVISDIRSITIPAPATLLLAAPLLVAMRRKRHAAK